MAFRVPHSLLSKEHIQAIRKDLGLVEGENYYQSNYLSTKNKKKIDFYRTDDVTKEIYLPMHYASTLFQKPIINQIRTYPQVPPFEMIGQPRDYQIEVINQSLNNFMKRGTTFLNVFCSYGKTWVTAYLSSILSKEYGLVTLVTCHLNLIKNSWIGTFRNQTTAKIYVMGEEHHPPDPDVNVFICMDTQLTQLPEEIRRRVGHFAVDEIDCYCTPGRKDGLLSIEPKFMTALTATYERDDGFHKMIDLMVGEERITKISKKPFFVFQVPTDFAPVGVHGPYGVQFGSLLKELDQMEARNSLALQLIMDNPKEKILVLTKHVEHAKNFTNWLRHYFQGTDRTVSLLAGNVRKYEDASVIVATISKAGRGYDEKEACIDWKGQRINMLIFLSSTMKVEQTAGRVFRADFPVIIDIVDNHRNLKKHWGVRRKWYESRNGVIYTMRDRICWDNLKDHALQQYFQQLETKPATRAAPTIPGASHVDSLSQAHLRSLLGTSSQPSQPVQNSQPIPIISSTNPQPVTPPSSSNTSLSQAHVRALLGTSSQTPVSVPQPIQSSQPASNPSSSNTSLSQAHVRALLGTSYQPSQTPVSSPQPIPQTTPSSSNTSLSQAHVRSLLQNLHL